MKERLSRLLTILAALVLLGSCKDGNRTDGPAYAYLTDIATFEGNTPDGSGSVFTVRMMDDSPLATLKADRPVEKTKPSARMMIYYLPHNGKPYTDTDISLVYTGSVNQETPVTAPEHAAELLPLFGRDPVKTVSVWRTGEYINIHMQATECQAPRTMAFVLVPGTIAAGEPEYRLVHALPAGAPPSYMRTVYASYNISDVWSAPGTRLVRVSLNPGETFIFKKQ